MHFLEPALPINNDILECINSVHLWIPNQQHRRRENLLRYLGKYSLLIKILLKTCFTHLTVLNEGNIVIRNNFFKS